MSSLHIDSRRTSSEQQLNDLDETASLLLSRTRSQEFSLAESIAVQEFPPCDDAVDAAATTWPRSARYLVLLCAFLTSLSFGVTQVPLLYVFRLMTCDAYYEDHPSQDPNPIAQSLPAGMTRSILSYGLASIAYSTGTKIENDSDRCSIHAIESSTALSVSLLGASTTVFGLLNLFLTNSLIKRIGIKPTLLIQVFFPAIRLLVQNVGVEVWGNAGIIIIQCSQIVSIFGGPSGYLLVLNTFITEVVEYEGRTAALGRLTGSMMFGSALGFLLGGVVAEIFGIKAPFRLTLMLFLTSCAYVAIFLPNIPPAEAEIADTGPISSEKKRGTISKFFGPLAVFAPRKFIGRDGAVQTEYGAFLLAWGVFLGILATGYLPTLLQLYSTDVFGFGTTNNGWLIFMYSMLRGVFLTFAFPKLITIGRKLTTEKEEEACHARSADGSVSPEREPLLMTQVYRATAAEVDADRDSAYKKEQTFTFDLTYTRFSLIADGLLTLLCSFVREGWQMYLVAAVLPFAAGTGSAAKGTILQMVGSSASSSERTDALAGVSLVENMARLSTSKLTWSDSSSGLALSPFDEILDCNPSWRYADIVMNPAFVFGVVFAAFASIGRTELVFTCNAAVALIGFGVLLFARFPPEGSHRLDKQDLSEPESSCVAL